MRNTVFAGALGCLFLPLATVLVQSAEKKWEAFPPIVRVNQLSWEAVKAKAEAMIAGCRADSMGDFFGFSAQNGAGQPYDMHLFCAHGGEGKLGNVTVHVLPFDKSFENNYLALVKGKEVTSLGFYLGTSQNAVYLAIH